MYVNISLSVDFAVMIPFGKVFAFFRHCWTLAGVLCAYALVRRYRNAALK